MSYFSSSSFSSCLTSRVAVECNVLSGTRPLATFFLKVEVHVSRGASYFIKRRKVTNFASISHDALH